MKKIDLTLVLACYNEGPTLKQSLQKIVKILSDTKFNWQIIAIDDSSDDKTYKTLANFAQQVKNFEVSQNTINLGRGGTVTKGMLRAEGSIVGYIDVDLEISPVYIPEFIRAIYENNDVVIATRIYKESFFSITRWILSKGYLILVTKMLRLKIRDTEAGYKFFKRKKILPILGKIRNKGWFFDTEIVALSAYNNLKIKEIPVLFLRRHDKKSTVRLIPDTLSYIKALIEFKKVLLNKDINDIYS